MSTVQTNNPWLALQNVRKVDGLMQVVYDGAWQQHANSCWCIEPLSIGWCQLMCCTLDA